MFTAQNQLLKVFSPLSGIDAQIKFMRSGNTDTDETYALLQEYGTVLSIDIIDMLNRSLDRADALNKYSASLYAMNGRIKQKITELKERRDDIETERRAKKKVVNKVKRTIRHALKDKNYAIAGPKQEELGKLEAELAEIKTRERQTKKIYKISRDLLEVGEDRHEAIARNREILIAGLQVIEVPGIEDLKIVIEE